MLFKFGSRMKVATSCGYGGLGGGGGMGNGSGDSMGPGYGGGRSMNGNTRYNPIFDDLSEGTIVDQFMPVDPRRLHRIWRRIFLQDPVAGPAVELMGDIPWSGWDIAGISDPSIRHTYEDCLNAIGAVALMPEVTREFLTMGKYIAHLLFDDSKGYFTDCIIQDPDFVKITPVPVPGWQPKMDLIPTPEMRAWASSQDPRDIEAHDALGNYAEELRAGKEIPLDPANTIYVARKTASYDSVGASIFTRILMFVAYEKALVNSTITAAKRRASRIRHITAGIDGTGGWEPEPHTLQEIADSFMRADEDPVGAIVVTRTGISAAEVGGNTPQDMIRISDEWDFLSKGKMNALGVSEQFLSGDATYNSMEQVLGVFLDRMRALRAFHVVNLLDEITKRVARANDYVERSSAELAHRVRRGSSRSRTDEELIIPQYAFLKALKPVGDETYMNILSTLEEKGFPIPIRTWASAAGFNLDDVDSDALKEDLVIRKTFATHQRRVQAFAAEAAGEPGGGGGLDLGGGGEGDLGDLGGGGDEGLGEDLGDLGDLGEDLGGGEEGGGEDLGGGGEEAPVKASSFQEPILHSISQLALWGPTGTFLGLRKDACIETAKRLLRLPTTATTRDIRQQLRTGHSQRDSVCTYILIRVGMLRGLKIASDIGSDIAQALCALKVKNLMDELAYVQACTVVSEATRDPDKRDNVLPLQQLKLQFPGNNAKLIATGYTRNRKIIGA